ncbi:MAG: tRNA (guanosine(18)-2'-O)-methyltransferase TrmH [Proteobacteria bacterium]|nr:tRNA (guanosine(18)-2'-O)-methyltransferase TrmH [Pseudomonadota bacterium]
MTPERLSRVDTVLARRQPDLTVLLEKVYKPHNFSAILRSCDAVGIPRVYAVPHDWGIPEIGHITSGAHKWLEVEEHENAGSAIRQLKQDGFQVVAAHLSDRAVDFREVDYCRPTAVVMGTEKTGVTAETLANIDTEIIIPMLGMTPSLNVSVACAVILYEAQRQRQQAGLYRKCRLAPAEHARLRFEWLHPVLTDYCRRHKLAYPTLDENGDLAEPFPPKK